MIPIEGRIQRAIAAFLEDAPYHPCGLLIHEDVLKLEQAGLELARHFDWPILDVGLLLGEVCLALAPKERTQMVLPTLRQAVMQATSMPLLVDLPLLCEPTLEVDVLACLNTVSQLRPLLALWPGSYVAGILAYATPAHAHYHTWRTNSGEAFCIPI